MELRAERGWFIGKDLKDVAEYSVADPGTGRSAVGAVRVMVAGEAEIVGRPLFFVEEGGGKSSLVIDTVGGDGQRRIVISGDLKYNESQAVGINFRV